VDPPPDGWRTIARRFATDVVAPAAESIDRTDQIPSEVRTALRRSGLMGLGLPREWGGGGGGATDVVDALEEISAASAAVATELAVHLSVAAMPIAHWGTADQKERFLRPLAEGRALGAFGLTEPAVGSDTARLETRYSPDGDAVRLRGSKMFITNGAIADVVLVFATRDPGLGHRGISAFLITKGTPGFSVAQRLDKLGLRGSETTELVFDDARVPVRNRLGPEGAGLKVALGALTGGRVGIGACALGVARAAYEAMSRSARADPADWKRSAVARAFSEITAVRSLLTEAARQKDAGQEYVAAASAGKLLASQAAVRLAHRAFDLAGPAAQRAGSIEDRLLRDARVFPIVEGTTEIQELILGRELLGREPAPDGPSNPL
jgi:alkylation response protein AidB-like acyl-CoA dehydrogenase